MIETKSYGYVALLALLLAASGCGNNVNKERDMHGFTALHTAVRKGNMAQVNGLFEAGARANVQDPDGVTPLHRAASQDDLAMAELLLKHYADPNITNREGWNPLHVATHKQHAKMVELLLTYKAEPDLRTMDGATPMHIAAQRGNLEIAGILLRKWPSKKKTKNGKDANLNWKNNEGYTPLLLAISKGHYDLVSRLAVKGTDLSIGDSQDKLPLYHAIKENQLALVNAFLLNGADINDCGDAKHTPLALARTEGHEKIAKMIWERGGR